SYSATEDFTETHPSRFLNSLTPKRQRVEAEVGIDRISPSTSHSKSIVCGIADSLTIIGLRSLSTRIRAYLFQSVLTRFQRSVLALLLALFFTILTHYDDGRIDCAGSLCPCEFLRRAGSAEWEVRDPYGACVKGKE